MKKQNVKISCRKAGIALLWSLALTILVGCSSSNSASEDTSTFDPNRNYFPDRVSIDHAIGFDVVYHNHWKELQLLRHYNDFVDTVSFALVQRGTPNPDGFEATRTIQIPVEKVGSLSTTHLGMFQMLDALGHLK